MSYWNGNIARIVYGNNEIAKAYYGADVVFQSNPYKPAEYIETSGGAYLNTGIRQISRNFEYTIRLAWIGTDINAFESFFGYMAPSGVTPRSGFHKYTGKWMFGTNVTKITGVTPDSNIHTIFVTGNASQNKETLFIDNSKITDATTTSNGISGNSITFFMGSRNRSGSVDNNCFARFYALNYKFFGEAQHTTIILEKNLVPFLYEGVFGMYDTIAQEFLPSISGTQFNGKI